MFTSVGEQRIKFVVQEAVSPCDTVVMLYGMVMSTLCFLHWVVRIDKDVLDITIDASVVESRMRGHASSRTKQGAVGWMKVNMQSPHMLYFQYTFIHIMDNICTILLVYSLFAPDHTFSNHLMRSNEVYRLFIDIEVMWLVWVPAYK